MLLSVQAFAHNLWIETSATGKKGQEHSAKIFLGGYGENERDSVQQWFSNTAEVVIWLASPDGTQQQLEKKADGNGFKVSFTPAKEGVYTLWLKHEVAEVYGTTKYVYYAGAKVRVGGSAAGQEWSSFSDLAVQTTISGKEISAKALYKNQPAATATMAVGAPSGWSKHLELEGGAGKVEAIWNGLYVFEAFYREKTSGTWNGKEYTTVMHIATFDTEISH